MTTVHKTGRVIGRRGKKPVGSLISGERGFTTTYGCCFSASGTLCSSFFFFRVSSYDIVNSVCWSHALVNGPTSKRPASDGGLYSGQLLMMWSAVCSGSPHSHAALSASPISSWMLYIDRPQFANNLGSSSVFGTYLLP